MVSLPWGASLQTGRTEAKQCKFEARIASLWVAQEGPPRGCVGRGCSSRSVLNQSQDRREQCGLEAKPAHPVGGGAGPLGAKSQVHKLSHRWEDSRLQSLAQVLQA